MRGDVEQRVSETLTIDVKPGWKKGTKITFPEKGDEAPGVIAADIVFVIDEKRHPQFERDGNDLVKTVKVDLRRVSVARAVSPRGGLSFPSLARFSPPAPRSRRSTL